MLLPLLIASRSNIQRQLVDLRAQQLYQRETQATQEDCEGFLDIFFGVDSGCECVLSDNGLDYEPNCDELLDGCESCETIQGVETCLSFDLEASATADGSTELEVLCYVYSSGAFGETTICQARDSLSENCTLSIDGAECNSCSIVQCGADNPFYDEYFDYDCSNVIEGESWNLCSDNISDTSPFIFAGNNELFTFADCFPGLVSGGSMVSFSTTLAIIGLVSLAVLY